MRRVRSLVSMALVGIGALGLGLSSFAHHTSGSYDFDQQIAFEGEVATLIFKNPRISMTLTRTLPDGSTETIHFVEGPPAAAATRSGLTAELIKPGTRITAIGSPDSEDPNSFFLRKVRLADGREFL